MDVSNAFQNKNVPIHELFCVVPPPYYLYCFFKPYLNVTLNSCDGTLCIQCMNGIQVTKPPVRQPKRLIGSVVTVLKYNKIPIDHTIYIRVFSDGNVYYLKFSVDDVLNTTNNK